LGARVSEVKVNSNIEDEWRWLEGNCNPADLGTRSKATPKDMIPGSEYQEGKPWMTEPENTWSYKKSFSPAPTEEFRKDMLEGACYVVKEARSHGEQEDDFPEVKKGGLERLIRVYGFVMAAVHKWRKKQGAAGSVLINPTKRGECVIGYPSAKCLRSAELFLLERAQKGMKIPGAKMLAMNTVTEEDINGVKRKLILIGSRGRNQIKGVYGTGDLPVMAKDHKLSKLYVQAAHEEGHEGAVSTLRRSKRKVWVTNGRAVAESVRLQCTVCRLKEKKCMEQRMGPMPDHRVELGAIFQSWPWTYSGQLNTKGP
jgi:hypothetical protein